MALLLGVFLAANAQETFTIEGTVTDARTGFPISSVNIVVRGTQLGVATDSLGYFALELPTEKRHVVSISHIGYEKWIKDFIVLSPRELQWSVKLSPQAIDLSEIKVSAERPFSSKRARYILTGVDFEKVGEPDLERALRYLLPNVVAPWDARLRHPDKDFTLYLDGEWLESFDIVDIDPLTVRQVLVWDGLLSPIAYPVRRGNFVVSIETEKKL